MLNKKASDIFSGLKLSPNQRYSSIIFKLFPLKLKIRGSVYFEEEVVIEAIKQLEKKKQGGEILGEIFGVKKRRYLKGLTLEVGGRRFGVKYYNFRNRFWRLMENLFYGSEAWRNFQLMNHLLSKGLLTPAPVALVEFCFLGVALESFLIMEDLSPAKTYKEVVQEVESTPEELERFLREIFFKLSQFNNAGLYSLDFDKNLLIKKEAERYQIYFLDFDNVFPFRRTNPRRSARSIYFLLRVRKVFQKLNQEQMQGLIDFYLAQIGKSSWRGRLIKELKIIASRKNPEDLFWLEKQIS